MRNRIEHPKVFISYAWGSEDYKIKVLSDENWNRLAYLNYMER